MWLNTTMSISLDLERMESRIQEVVRQSVATKTTERIPAALSPLLDTVVNQAVQSSEGGKRLRARLTIDTYTLLTAHRDTANTMESSEQLTQAVIDIACAIEVFQTAALVHDDIIDDSDMRRGKPSAHHALSTRVHNRAIGNGLGLMLGDLLASSSMDIMNTAAAHLPASDAIRSTFITMHHDVEIGQILDLAIEQMPLDNPHALCDASYEVFRWKTASYTTIAPLQMAYLAAGMSQEDAQHHAYAIGEPLGVAFQLADDLLDVIGSSANTGKPVGGDIREGKRTVLLADALAQANQTQRDELITMYQASSRTQEQVSRVIALFQETHAIDRSYARIQTMWNRTCDAITHLPVNDATLAAMTAICARFVPSSVLMASGTPSM